MVSDSVFCHIRLLNSDLKVPNQSFQHLHEKICFTASQALPKEQILQYSEIGKVIIVATSYIREKDKELLHACNPHLHSPTMDQTVSYFA